MSWQSSADACSRMRLVHLALDAVCIPVVSCAMSAVRWSVELILFIAFSLECPMMRMICVNYSTFTDVDHNK